MTAEIDAAYCRWQRAQAAAVQFAKLMVPTAAEEKQLVDLNKLADTARDAYERILSASEHPGAFPPTP